MLALAGLALWALVNGGLVMSGFSDWPLISLVLGLCRRGRHRRDGHAAGAAHWLDFLRYCGEHSIVIYLAFFLPMAATRTLLLKTGVIPDIGTISLIVTVVGVAGALALIWRLARHAGADFLFERPGASGSRRRSRERRRCSRRSKFHSGAPVAASAFRLMPRGRPTFGPSQAVNPRKNP